ncbi:alpha-galactosidase [Paenibacillus sp. F411]|uniref:Alpha-galactosidase n=1 Tax=Paenibacillus algicola TaxID=2565926 RepID=A0A4V1G3H2_9BACL|nr:MULTISPECIES: alpha-galactosidase [Paenibacillus]MBO2945886.1 alpha-galactosidase [Paenibacillus sp. F411]QCT01184.1 glycoside hydrolase [Paenibacillus algicola]
MPIYVDKNHELFHLQSKNSSYIIQIVRGYAAHVYYGPKLRQGSNLGGMLKYELRSSFTPNTVPDDKTISLDTLPQEYPQYGSSDFRSPGYQVKLENGSRITELVYESHAIYAGKPELEGLPAVYVEQEREAETLELTLADHVTGLKVVLCYSVFADFSAITRSVRFENGGEETLALERALSASLDFADSRYEVLYLSGAWARERHIQRRRLAPGSTSIGSRRGSSSHQLNPFMALVRPETTEHTGDAYGFSLVYSGSFMAEAEVEQFGMARLQIGMNPFDFSWQLNPGEGFQTPEAVLVYSDEGLGGMSREYHRLYRTRLCRGVHRDRERPILINNWEATYFDFNADKIEEIAKAGSELGIELFVLDDGWFGRRDKDNSSLGDWYEDRRKLPGGLADLAERVRATGLQFGLWFEPEMVSPDSDLYRSHPDWCLHVPNRRRTEAREQLILDMSREDVRAYVYERLSDIFRNVPISYVKWDMNRNMTEIGSAALPAHLQRETAHRYMLGLYGLLERITTEFPDILFESCSGGGGRFDPGILYYMPQTWTSDNTDAVERLKIQYGTSLVYPVSTMGAHVSAVPNHQVERTTSLSFRGDVAMSGNFGYELDLTRWTEEEKEIAAQQVKDYKEIRGLVQQGDLYRLLSPFEGNETAWMFVSPDKSEALVFYFKVLAEPNGPLQRVQLAGLDAGKDYQIGADGEVMGGDRLMAAGLPVSSLHGDFSSMWVRLKAVN